MSEFQKEPILHPQHAHERVAEHDQRLRELNAFAATSVSHELRESLVSIGGFARTIELEDTRLSPASRSRLRRIAQAALQMERVIDDAVALARSERFEVEKGDLRLDEMVRHVLREIQPAYPATRVILSELPIIHADPVVVRPVLVNVIANAFKYSALAPEPAVEVSLDTSGALQVIDNGIGFPQEDAARIFEPFVRLTRDPAYPGLGLGLTAVRKWLHGHGGWIRAESREGGPTRFAMSFGD
jgi:signal transduction histidine kinase